MQGGAGLLKYVEGHIYLRQTCAAPQLGGGEFTPTEMTNGTELRFQRCFKRTEDQILGFIVHGGLLSMWLRRRMTHLRRSVNINMRGPTYLLAQLSQRSGGTPKTFQSKN